MLPGVVDMQPAALPGAYNATFANGQSMLVHGQSADNLYQRYQANAPKQGLPEGALAQNDANQSVPEENQSRADAPVRMGTTTVSAPQGGQQEPTPVAPSAEEGPHKIPGGAAMSLARARELAAEHPAPEQGGTQRAAMQVPPAQARGGQPRIGEPLGYSMKAVDPATGKEVEGPAVMTPDGPRVFIQGTRGSPGGLTGVGKDFMRHAGESEQQITEARAQEQEATQRGSELAKRQAEEEFGFLKEQQKQAIIQQQQQEEENRQMEAHVKELDARYQAARDEARDSKVDAGRYMRGNWLATLGMALGSFGAALGHHENFAANFVNQQIDRDIRSQEKEIEVKRDTANNALAELTRSQGSLAAGKLALRQILLEKAQVQLQTLAGSYKGAQLQAAAQQAAAQIAEQHAQADLQRKQSYVDKAMHDRVYYSPGSAGRSAGMLVPTQGSMASRQEGQLRGREMALKENKAAQGAVGGKMSPKMQSQIVAARNARDVTDEIAGTLGMKRDENGEYQDPTVGGAIMARMPFTDEHQNFEAAQESFISEIGKAQNGGNLSDSTAERMIDQARHAKTPGELGAMLRHYDGLMRNVEKNVRNVAATTTAVGSGAETEP